MEEKQKKLEDYIRKAEGLQKFCKTLKQKHKNLEKSIEQARKELIQTNDNLERRYIWN